MLGGVLRGSAGGSAQGLPGRVPGDCSSLLLTGKTVSQEKKSGSPLTPQHSPQHSDFPRQSPQQSPQQFWGIRPRGFLWLAGPISKFGVKIARILTAPYSDPLEGGRGVAVQKIIVTVFWEKATTIRPTIEFQGGSPATPLLTLFSSEGSDERSLSNSLVPATGNATAAMWGTVPMGPWPSHKRKEKRNKPKT